MPPTHIHDRNATVGLYVLVTYAMVTTIGLTCLGLYFETVVRQSPPVIECAVPVTRSSPK